MAVSTSWTCPIISGPAGRRGSALRPGTPRVAPTSPRPGRTGRVALPGRRRTSLSVRRLHPPPSVMSVPMGRGVTVSDQVRSSCQPRKAASRPCGPAGEALGRRRPNSGDGPTDLVQVAFAAHAPGHVGSNRCAGRLVQGAVEVCRHEFHEFVAVMSSGFIVAPPIADGPGRPTRAARTVARARCNRTRWFAV